MTGKQLKNSILQWAIQGKLVPQDPNDEPASVLLERIRAEKARLVKEGKIKKDKNESIIFRGEDNSYYEKFADGKMVCINEEIPFDIPQCWEWTRLRTITSLLGDGIHGTPEYDINGSYYFINGNNLKEKRIFIKPETKKVNEAEYLKYKKDLNEKTVLVSINGTLGNVAFYNNELIVLGKSACYFNLLSKQFKSFIYIVLISPYFLEYALSTATGTTIKNVSLQAMNSLLVPFPSITEQCRIVEKLELLDTFFTKYSQLEKQLSFLNDNILQELQKSILQEAIKGRLVKQAPNDEPASILLEHIKEEKLRLVKEGKLKKKDIVDSVIYKGDDNKYYEIINGEEIDINDELPFEIPDSWSWTRLGFITSNEAGLSYNKEYLNDETGPFIRVLRGGNIEEGRWFTREDDVIISQKYVKNCLLLKKGTFITPAVTSIERMAKTALIEDDQKDVVVGGFVLMIKPFMLTTAFLQYLNLFFQTTYYKQYCIGITNKSGQAFYNLSRQKLMQCFVPIPPIEEQRRIVEKYSLLSL